MCEVIVKTPAILAYAPELDCHTAQLTIAVWHGDDGYRPKPRGYYLHVMRYTYDDDNIRYVRTRIGDPANFWLFASPAAVQRKSKKRCWLRANTCATVSTRTTRLHPCWRSPCRQPLTNQESNHAPHNQTL